MPLVVVHLVLAPEGELPAHLGLERHRVHPAPHCCDVEGAARSGREVRAVEEDAGVLVEACDRLAVLVGVDHGLLDAVVLPVLRRERGGDLLHVPGVLLVDEMRSVAAAALHQLRCRSGQHSLAPVAEDAGPVARQERAVEDPRPFLVFVFEAQPLVRVGRCGRHGQARYSGGRRTPADMSVTCRVSPPRRTSPTRPGGPTGSGSNRSEANRSEANRRSLRPARTRGAGSPRWAR